MHSDESRLNIIVNKVCPMLPIESILQLRTTCSFFYKRLPLKSVIIQIIHNDNVTFLLSSDGNVFWYPTRLEENNKYDKGVDAVHLQELHSITNIITNSTYAYFITREGFVFLCDTRDLLSIRQQILDEEQNRSSQTNNISSQRTDIIVAPQNNDEENEVEEESIFEQIPIDNVKQILFVSGNIFYLKNHGKVWACGGNFLGVLGFGDNVARFEPTQLLELENIAELFGKDNLVYGRTSSGQVYVWGDNSFGRSGCGKADQYLKPTLLPLSDIKKVYIGSCFQLFLANDGQVFANGYNQSAVFGLGFKSFCDEPTWIPGLDNIVEIANFLDESLVALKNDGTVYAAGRNYMRVLGLQNQERFYITYTQIPNLNNVVQVMSDNFNMYFLTADNRLYVNNAPNFILFTFATISFSHLLQLW